MMFSAQVRAGRYEEAEQTLVRAIRESELVDPADDFSWGVAADALAYPLLSDRGPGAFRAYHQRLLDLFVNELEPTLGHLHKGHLYYRLASGALADDFEASLAYLRAAIEEDRVKGGIEGPGRETAASIFLLALEGAAAAERTNPQWAEFRAGLPWIRFEVALEGMTVDGDDLKGALATLLDDGASRLAGLHTELDTAVSVGLGRWLSFMVSEFVRQIVRSALGGGLGADGAGDLAATLDEAATRALFPTPLVASTFRLAALWQSSVDGNPHSMSESPRELEATRLVAVTIKVLVDRAIVEWADRSG